MSAPPAIDLVCCFVDGADPAHRARRQIAWDAATAAGQTGLVNAAGQFEQVGELTFGVRSVLHYMPWVRHVIVVTDDQTPPIDAALMASGRVRIVQHHEFIPPRYRPVFSGAIIESFLHRIAGLSDIWLYNNDDFLIGEPLAVADFVSASGQLVERCYPALFRQVLRRALKFGLAPGGYRNPYTYGIANALELLQRQMDFRASAVRTPRHFTQVYRRSTGYFIDEHLGDALEGVRARHFRNFSQVSFGTLMASLELVRHGTVRPSAARRRTSRFFDVADARTPKARERLWQAVAESRASFLCINNIPLSDRTQFERAMAARGLGERSS
jgi:hypothetical protein